MARRLSELVDFKVGRSAGEALPLIDFLIDEHTRDIRYLVVDAGKWMPQRKVLIAPDAIEGVREDEKLLQTSLSRDDLENGPRLDADSPLSRSDEEKLVSYYQWPMYWQAVDGRAVSSQPAETEQGLENREQAARVEMEDESERAPLRSYTEIKHYRLKKQGSASGELQDVLVNDHWRVSGLEAQLQGQAQVLSGDQLAHISWDSQVIEVA
ncbi:MAG: hypothetical protein E1N59_1358 [Puniceicoccaceae bacterium 5H]|nr:MAG: hypothetical protein E1N59_1358 [Puniceicoccaceae bacterium 5H]